MSEIVGANFHFEFCPQCGGKVMHTGFAVVVGKIRYCTDCDKFFQISVPTMPPGGIIVSAFAEKYK